MEFGRESKFITKHSPCFIAILDQYIVQAAVLMPNVCILTDSTAQFTQAVFPGRERVHIIPPYLQGKARHQDQSLPCGVSNYQGLIEPSSREFIGYYTRLSQDYESILVLTLSSLLFPAMQNALLASLQHANHATVEVIDSLTVSVGLGMLVQIAAGAASGGASLVEIEQQLRKSIPHIYMLFCIPELTRLSHMGLMSYNEGAVGEMLGLLPIFAMEEGHLVPMEKVRTPRHLFDSFQDFIGEFETPAHIALVCGAGWNAHRTRPLRDYAQDLFPTTPFSEHSIEVHLAALFGPQCTGLVIMEKTG
jgi:DegV family protein with EDD domain